MFLFPGGATVAASKVTVEFCSRDNNTTNQQNYTFSDKVVIGATGGTVARKLIIGAMGDNVAAISSITAGGAGTTSVASAQDGNMWCHLWYIDTDQSSPADIVINTGGVGAHMGMQCLAVYGAAAGAPASNDTSTASPLTASVDIAANGAALGVGVGTTTSWTATNMTEVDDSIVEGGTYMTSAVRTDTDASPQTGMSLTLTEASTTKTCGVFLTFNPA
jgi:hypothetical protein